MKKNIAVAGLRIPATSTKDEPPMDNQQIAEAFNLDIPPFLRRKVNPAPEPQPQAQDEAMPIDNPDTDKVIPVFTDQAVVDPPPEQPMEDLTATQAEAEPATDEEVTFQQLIDIIQKLSAKIDKLTDTKAVLKDRAMKMLKQL